MLSFLYKFYKHSYNNEFGWCYIKDMVNKFLNYILVMFIMWQIIFVFLHSARYDCILLLSQDTNKIIFYVAFGVGEILNYS